MKSIHLRQTLPQVFADRNSITSDIWHKNVVFSKGEMYLIEAASGTGKSSLCSYIYGYRNDYQGIINFDETNIKAYSVEQWVNLRKHSLSMLFQDLRLFTELTALENIQLKNNLTGYKKKKEILALFETMGIADKAHIKAGKLSFGQQQRVAFIRALCQPFDFIFLDEPISHLDDCNGKIMSNLLLEEAGRQEAGIIVTSIGKHIELPYNHVLRLLYNPIMTLIWKLLRQHISIGQLAGFFFANLFGMMIVLLSVQFYKDIIPMFTEGDSFMKKDYIIVSKRISTLGSFAGKSNTFSPQEIKELKQQPFTEEIGIFTPSQFKVSAGLGMQEAGIRLSTDMFFEAVPDEFVDVKLDKWHFDEETRSIPIIIPRNYLNLYNFGFAQSRSLPKLSEGVMSLVQMDITLRGNGQTEQYKGNIVGFSNRLNTILVPESFMKWANNNFAPEKEAQPARLIVEVGNPADASIAKYFQQKGYETEDGKLDAGKTTYFLRLIVGIVLGVGLFISILSFYILMLSIFLLLQKNTTKLENLLLIGYSPARVARPYQVLTLGLNTIVLAISLCLVAWIRHSYTGALYLLFPQLEIGSLWPAVSIGVLLFIIVSVINILAIRRKILSIWMHKS